MARGLVEPASPEQIALYGHIAARLRAEMLTRGWKQADFNKAIGRSATNSAIYVWLACKSAPGKATRVRISKALKIPMADLTPRDEVADKPAAVKAERVSRQEVEGYVPPPPPPVKRDVLSFSIDSEGMSRIKFDVTFPALKGAALLQVLLNAGLAMEPDNVE